MYRIYSSNRKPREEALHARMSHGKLYNNMTVFTKQILPTDAISTQGVRLSTKKASPKACICLCKRDEAGDVLVRVQERRAGGACMFVLVSKPKCVYLFSYIFRAVGCNQARGGV